MCIENLKKWLGDDAPSPRDTELKRIVRDAMIEYDVVIYGVGRLKSDRAKLMERVRVAEERAAKLEAQLDAVECDCGVKAISIYASRNDSKSKR